MEKKELKFLILLFYYNRPKMVVNALNSINKLSYKNFEIFRVQKKLLRNQNFYFYT